MHRALRLILLLAVVVGLGHRREQRRSEPQAASAGLPNGAGDLRSAKRQGQEIRAEPAAHTPLSAKIGGGNRLAYLDENNPWYPHRGFPKLITPQWVGEEGVECVVVLAIDDMRDPAKYEAFLRPILNRLKQIDGRAPVSIMTCNIKPDDPQLAQWLAEGLSFEVHTVDHPCPLLQAGDFAKAKSTYDRCVDLLNEIPGNKPVAFRMPCCDSLNTLSPRFYSEIFNKTTPKGNFLSISSSVFNLFTPNDPEIPRELVLDADGRDKFRKYIPRGLIREGKTFDTFVNYIEDYPYPYVINRLCWEFPCVVPSDWSAQHLQKPNNPDTLRDLKAALDITVRKQGVYNLVFHPHGWIKAKQIVELIEHAVATHGRKVKFLTFREALERLQKSLLNGGSLRNSRNGMAVTILDLDGDGYQDVVSTFYDSALARLWSSKDRSWGQTPLPGIKAVAPPGTLDRPIFAFLEPHGVPSALCRLPTAAREAFGGLRFDGNKWISDQPLAQLPIQDANAPAGSGHFVSGDAGIRFRDLDHDGSCEFLIANGKSSGAFRWNESAREWTKLPFTVPPGITFATTKRMDNGVRFVDVDEDGRDDIVFSNAEKFGVYLFNNMQTGWSRVVLEGTRSVPEASGRREPAGRDAQPAVLQSQRGATPPSPPLRRGGAADRPAAPSVNGELFELPPIVRADGTDNGFFVHSRHLFWQSEDTAQLTDLVDRRSFNEILAQADLPPKPKSPAASLESIRVRPGFKLELMAAEPLVLDPITFAFGADGKLWVVEMGDYPLGVKPGDKGGGQIRRLEDTDGDGKYDKATVFLEVPFPTGVLPWRKGILVTAAPDILYAEDTDGDGKADKREVLYTGFVEGNQQHRVNGLVWGPDNWLYVANGDSGGVIVSKKTGKKVNIGGRDLRIHPDSGDLDAVTGQTQFGRSRDDWGNWFGCNNSNPMYQFVLDDAYQRRNPHFAARTPRIDVPEVAGNAPVFAISQLLTRFNDFHTANRFTSACSAMIYRDDLFGPHFAGNAFICEPVHNLVHREIVTPKGVTFTSRRAADEEQSEFLASSDNWFRPTTVKTGPDGALWIADMYRHVIEHPQWIPDTWQKRLDLRAGHDKGRIYRVYPVDKKPRPIPRLDKLDTAGLIAALDSPSGWERDVAQQLLIERNDKAAVALLEERVQNSSNPLCRLHALCTLSGFGPVAEEVLAEAVEDTHPGVRRHAVRLAGVLKGDIGRNLFVALKHRCTDSDPHVQLQLAYTLGELNEPEAADLLGVQLATVGDDRFIRAALFSSVNAKNIAPVLTGVLGYIGQSEPNPAVIGDVLGLAAVVGNDQTLADVVEFITVKNGGRPPAWKFIAFARLLDSLERRNESLLERLKRSKAPNLQKLLDAVDRLFVTARAWSDEAYSPETRVAALPLLGRGPRDPEFDLDILAGCLGPQTPAEVQDTAVIALGHLRHERVPALFLDRWRSFGPVRRAQVLDILLARDAWAAKLLDAVEEETVSAAEFDAARRQRLLQHRSAVLRRQAAKAFAIAVNADRQKVIEQYQPALTASGDVTRGAQLFAKTCAQCHKLAGVGYDVGPDLASLTDKSAEALLVAVLDPNRAVESKFLNYVAETKAGTIYTGLLASETGNSITLRGPEGKEQVVLRADLEELVGTSKSTMPEGIEKDLRPQDLADIIAHVRANVPLPRRKEFAGNEPKPVTPAADGTLILVAAACEIYGSTLIFEPQYKNLGYWSSLDDHAVWTVEIPKTGKYAVEFDWACDASVAGNPWRLETPGGNLAGEVESTGNWDTYRQKKIGEVTLTSGRQRLVLRPVEKPQGAMIDLRSVRLVPTR
jgi:putative membrane-bound dehydrogenase-like protein